MKENQFSASPADSSCVKGITMFREGGKTFGQAWKTSEGEWKREKEVVGKVWKEVQGREMPRFGKVEKEARFGTPGKGRRYY
jgi:hypothetical protein